MNFEKFKIFLCILYSAKECIGCCLVYVWFHKIWFMWVFHLRYTLLKNLWYLYSYILYLLNSKMIRICRNFGHEGRTTVCSCGYNYLYEDLNTISILFMRNLIYLIYYLCDYNRLKLYLWINCRLFSTTVPYLSVPSAGRPFLGFFALWWWQIWCGWYDFPVRDNRNTISAVL